MTRDEMRAAARWLDQKEAELVATQHGMWRLRQQLQTTLREKIGFQYDDEPDGLAPKPKVRP